jgi:hypothetical protein
VYFLNSSEEWDYIHNEDLWIYNKLFLSRVLGYNCGPSGVSVPKPDFYIVRPSLNLMGMGRFSRIEWLEKDTEHLHPSEFWCEVFEGEHLSVDYYKKESSLIVRGTREPDTSLYKWSKWEKIERYVKYPSILNKLVGDYDWINCEFIDEKLIEVHFRRNADFRYGNSIAIPVWSDEDNIIDSKYKYVNDSDYLRNGFLID